MYGDAIDYYLASRPDMTGFWQVSGRNDTSLQDRLDLDVRFAGLLGDVVILLLTLDVILTTREGHIERREE